MMPWTRKQSSPKTTDPTSSMIGLVSTAELEAAQAELALFKGAINQAQTAIMMVDRDFNVTYVNDETCALLETNKEAFRALWPSLDPTNMVGCNIDGFHKNPERQRKILSDPANLPHSADITVGDLIFRLTVSAQLDASGNYVGNRLEWLDVTKARERERLNLEYQGQINAISRSQAMISFEPSGIILDANDNFLATVGYSIDEIQGKHHRMFIESKDQNSPEYLSFWSKLASGEFFSGRFKRITKAGEDVWILASYNPILDEHGNVAKIVKFGVNITDQVNAEQAAAAVTRDIEKNFENILSATRSADSETESAAQASQRTLELVSSVAAAIEEFSVSTQEISSSMDSSKKDVHRVTLEAKEANTATQELAQVSESMTSIVSIIHDIAAQINLLSLNATIEAARAGEAGKGFAVVATEVKSLARDVAKATDQISSDITAVQNVSRDVVRSLSSIQSAVESVELSVTGVAGSVDEQSSAIGEITRSMQAAAESVTTINQTVVSLKEATDAASAYTNHGQELYGKIKQTA